MVFMGLVAVADAKPAAKPAAVEPVVPAEVQDQIVVDEDAAAVYPPHKTGPLHTGLGHGVEIDLPDGMFLFEETEAKQMAAELGDDPTAVIAIVFDPDTEWGLSFDWSGVGHVSDADAAKLDAAELLRAIREGAIQQNAVRRAKHIDELLVDGWSTPPSYDRARRELRWGIELHNTSGPLLNELTNVLGRHGYVGVTLIADPDRIEQARIEAGPVLASVRFGAGHRYEDFDPKTDRSSGLNLRSLVVGAGVVAVASKGGWIAGVLLILKKAAVGIAAAAAGVWKWLTGRKKNASTEA